MEATILAKLRAVTNVTITRVSPGSINVASSVAFTEADSDMATANQDAFATLLGSADGAVSVYGSTFGAVSVSGVTKASAPNPGNYSLQPACSLIYIAATLAFVQLSEKLQEQPKFASRCSAPGMWHKDVKDLLLPEV